MVGLVPETGASETCSREEFLPRFPTRLSSKAFGSTDEAIQT
jgi:hypothetical protein